MTAGRKPGGLSFHAPPPRRALHREPLVPDMPPLPRRQAALLLLFACGIGWAVVLLLIHLVASMIR